MSATERRAHHRYMTYNLKVLVKHLISASNDWQTAEISAVDFNRYGIALECGYQFAVGDILSMVIRTDDSTIAEVNGIICNRREEGDHYRYGVRFEHNQDMQTTESRPPMSDELLMIEKQVAGALH